MTAWNTRLHPWFPNEADVINTIANTNFDVLTLEEVWTEAAKEKIVSHPVVQEKYKYSFYAPAHQAVGGCDVSVTPISFQADYITCLVDTGTDTRTVAHPVEPIDPDCQFLGLIVQLTSQPCFACLVNTMPLLPSGFNPLDTIDRCRGCCPLDPGVSYAHGGSPGRLILSKRPLEDLMVVEYDTFVFRRVAIYATIAGVRFGFAHWPTNYLFDLDPSLGPFQFGALQAQLALDMITQNPDVIVGDFNSGPDYQPEGHQLLLQNGYRPLFSQPTYCPEPTHASFPPCQVAELGSVGLGPRAIDNIYIKEAAGICRRETFAQQPISDHIGVAARCHLRSQGE
jgi:endonuclease/exonuclease/phosphatase family metal-dependent hydrolase